MFIHNYLPFWSSEVLSFTFGYWSKATINCPKRRTTGTDLGNLAIFVAHLSTIITRLLPKLRVYQFVLGRMRFKNNFDMSDSLFSLRLSGFIFRSGNFLPDPFFYTPP